MLRDKTPPALRSGTTTTSSRMSSIPHAAIQSAYRSHASSSCSSGCDEASLQEKQGAAPAAPFQQGQQQQLQQDIISAQKQSASTISSAASFLLSALFGWTRWLPVPHFGYLVKELMLLGPAREMHCAAALCRLLDWRDASLQAHHLAPLGHKGKVLLALSGVLLTCMLAAMLAILAAGGK